MKNVALITGAAKNIGKGIASLLLAQGYVCVLVDIDGAELAKSATELRQNGAECYEYVADIADTVQLGGLLMWLKEKDLAVMSLVNNAGYESSVSVADITTDEMTKSFATNLQGPMYLTSLMAKEWVQNNSNGNVVFITSTHSKVIRTHPLYSSSKAAIEMFIKEAAVEFAPNNIRVNSIAPGATQDTAEPKPDYRAPMGFYMQPKDIAEGVAFLLSDKARFITGQTIVIDGGYSITHTHHWLKQGKLPRPI